MHRPSRRESITYCLDDPLILFRLHIVGLRVALVHMIGFENMAQVHSVRVVLTHMVVAGIVATVPVRQATPTMAASSLWVMSMARLKAWVSEVLGQC